MCTAVHDHMRRRHVRPYFLAAVKISFLWSLLFPWSASGQWTSLGSVRSARQDGPYSAEIVTRSGRTILINFLTPDLFRVTIGSSRDLPSPTPAVVQRTWEGDRIRVKQTSSVVDISGTLMRVSIDKKTSRITVRDSVGSVLVEDHPFGTQWNKSEFRVYKSMPQDENYYGLGEKSGRFNRKWRTFAMWNTDIPAYGADTDPLYVSVPFFYGIRNGRAYGIYFDNSWWTSFDFGKEAPDRYSFGAQGGPLDYYIFSGPLPRDIAERFADLTGRMRLPPLWSLGFQQCRWSYFPDSRVREIAQTFRAKKIPCDVLYLDIDYMEGYRIFTWSQKNFPDPKGLLTDLAKDGFTVTTIVDPGIKADTAYHAYRSGLARNAFLLRPDGSTYLGKVWPGVCAFPDFSQSDARAWWGEQFQVLTASGVKGFWNDMNEPSVFDVPTKTVDLNVVHRADARRATHAEFHNLYGFQMTQATYEGTRRLLGNQRPFLLTRASFAGGQRYSAKWTGDNTSTWHDLSMALSMCLGISISGQPFVGSDIGGFIGSPDGELFARWMQLGVFTPLMRAHSAWDTPNKEPWEFGESIEHINRATVELRYTFLPYIYTVMAQSAVTGQPAMRPLAFAYPGEPAFAWNESEFLFGDDLLIAPVLAQRQTERTLRLPPGAWYDYWTGKRYDGNSNVTVAAPLERLPLFVRAGAAIPTRQVVQYTSQAPIDPLTLIVFPAASGSSTYYEDDGLSFAYENGVDFRRTLSVSSDSAVTAIRISRASGTYVPPPRSLVLRVVDHFEPSSVTLLGTSLQRLAPAAAGGPGWTYDAATRTVLIRTADSGEALDVSIVR